MTPTNRLRFVERKEYVTTDERGNYLPPDTAREVKRRVLQQWWQNDDPPPTYGVWHDVPLEAE